ncbi:Hypothetical_protein [Hexamita inflata]|uniref:Hypothetical_protein n=1 Tax=Hexamita inflata TaxID=28002 RepID=A0AA86TRW2_9EUKA|nr:Hypothetical protein HINF_LOCUS11987 [Hexamita inflata]
MNSSLSFSQLTNSLQSSVSNQYTQEKFVSTLVFENKVLREQLDKAFTQISSLNTQLHKLRDDNQQTEVQLNLSQSLNEELNNNQQQKYVDTYQLQSELKQLRKENQQLKMNIQLMEQSKNQQICSLVEQNEEYSQQCKNQNTKYNELLTICQKQKAKMQKYQSSFEQFVGKQDQLQQFIDEIQQAAAGRNMEQIVEIVQKYTFV